jgi:hypothetical protein
MELHKLGFDATRDYADLRTQARIGSNAFGYIGGRGHERTANRFWRGFITLSSRLGGVQLAYALGDLRSKGEMTNMTTLMRGMEKELKKIKAAAFGAFKAQEKAGQYTDNPDNPNYVLTPEMLGLDRRAMRQWREFMGDAGGLEPVLHEWYRNVKSKPPEEAVKTPFTDEQVKAILQWWITRTQTLTAEGTPTVALQKGATGYMMRALMQLRRWAVSYVGNMSRLFEMPASCGFWCHSKAGLVGILFILAIASTTGILGHELMNVVRSKLYRQPAGQLSIVNIVQNPSAEMIARYGGAVLARNVPVFGEALNSMFSGYGVSGVLSVPVVNWAQSYAKFINNTLLARRPFLRELEDLFRVQVPVSQVLINNLDWADADVRAMARVMRTIPPRGIETKSGGGGMPSRESGLSRQVLADIQRGDMKGARRSYETLIQSHRDKGRSVSDAREAAAQGVRAQMPDRKVFGRGLTAGQMTEIENTGAAFLGQDQAMKSFRKLKNKVDGFLGSGREAAIPAIDYSPPARSRQQGGAAALLGVPARSGAQKGESSRKTTSDLLGVSKKKSRL